MHKSFTISAKLPAFIHTPSRRIGDMSFPELTNMKNTHKIIQRLNIHRQQALCTSASAVASTPRAWRQADFSRAFLLILTCLLTHITMSGQTLSTFTHYNTEMGFVQKEVMKLAQDGKGQMWFATWNGLYKFDGYRFINYKARPGDGVMMESNRLETICIDGDNVWMRGYNGSISCFNTRTEEILDLPLSKYVADGTYHIGQGGILITMSGNRLVKATLNDGDIKIRTKGIAGLHNNEIKNIKADTQGKLYVLTADGLYSYDNSRERLTKEWGGNGRHSFFDMSRAGKTLVFCASKGLLLIRKDGRFIPKKLPTPANITSVASLPGGRILAATSGDGIYVLRADYTIEKHITTANSVLNTNAPGKLERDGHGDVWFCTGKPGVMRYDAKNGTLYHLDIEGEFQPDPSMWRNEVNIAEDSRGNLWVSPSGNGLNLFDRKANRLIPFFDHERQKAWTAENTLTDFFVDKQDNLWFCGKYTGLEKVTFNQRQFYYLDIKCSTESGKDVRGIFQDRDGNVWIGAKSGIISVFDKQLRHIGNLCRDGHVRPGTADNMGRAYCFAQDETGTIWIGTKFSGLLRLRQNGHLSFSITRFKTDARPGSLPHNDIFSLCIDRHKRLWIATYGGGICYMELNGKQTEFVSSKNRLKAVFPAKTRFITTDSKGTMWVGTTSGLFSFSENFRRPEEIRSSNYTRRPDDATSLSYNDVLEVFFTSKGEMYVCTYGGGFCHVRRNGDRLVFSPFTTSDGLRSDVIFSVQEDFAGNLWFSSENGLVKYSPEQNKTETFSSRYFGKHTDINEGVAIRLHDGKLLFPCRNHGVIYFNPQQVKVSSYVPRIILTHFFIGQNEILPQRDGDILRTSINSAGGITLPYDKNSFSIEFSALDFRDPDNISYSYMLHGFDKTWTTAGNAHNATFNNIPPGKYRFMVRSTNSDGVWVDNTKTIEITITPSFWQTGWAVLLYIILAFIMIAGSTYIFFTIFRLKQKVRIEEYISGIKLKFFTNISHEIRTPLTLISGSVKEILRKGVDDDGIRKSLTVVDRNSNRLLRLVNQILDIRKLETGNMHLSLQLTDLGQLVKSITANFSNIAEEQDIRLEFKSPDEPVMIWVDNDKLDKIVFNLLSNAFRFTPSGKSITVEVSSDRETARITVRDEGTGISPERLGGIFNRFSSTGYNGALMQGGTGIGLALTKELVELHHGTISAESRLHNGSTFTVSLPADGRAAYNDADYIIKEPENEGISGSMPRNGMSHDGNAQDGSCGIESLKTHAPARQTILVVEDNAEMRDFIRMILGSDYNITDAENGKEGLKLADSCTPDIIITDYMMPVMDGMEMAQLLRNNVATSHIPIIILSARTDYESKILGMDTGIDDYIEKPFSADILRARIRNIIARQENMRVYFRERYVDKNENGQTEISPADQNFMDKLMDILEKNISNGDLSVDDVASQLNMSRSIYFKKIKALTSFSPNEFVKAFRMRRASELIDTRMYSITEISMMVGINDAHYFSKCFKLHFGVTPTEWKNRKNNNGGI